jgi:hypothetical protein
MAAQQLRQLRNIRHDPPRFVFGEQLRGRIAALPTSPRRDRISTYRIRRGYRTHND